ncbi:MAG: ankyrin repeat domain-containing protein, partial [Legionella sp.]|nr:ankyrin repeat domain-containing protein [Legionella sp.]
SGTPEEEKHKHPYLKSIEKIVSHFATYGNAPKSAEYKVFGHTPFSYARASDKPRFILLVGITKQNEAALIVVNINEEHHYSKYAETKTTGEANDAFNQFIKQHAETLMAQGIEKIKGPANTVLLEKAYAKMTDLPVNEADTPVHQANDSESRIVLSVKQQQVINRIHLNSKGITVVNGPPGTGKTVLIMENCLEFAPSQGQVDIIQPSTALCTATRQLYENVRPVDAKSVVHFKTFAEWLRPFFPDKTEVDFTTFEAWLTKTNHLKTFDKEDKRFALYNEMQIAAGYVEPSLYLKTGQRSTRFEKQPPSLSGKPLHTHKDKASDNTTASRQTVLAILNDYLEVLGETQVDFNLCEPLFPEGAFSKHLFIGVDECQAAPPVMLKAILKITDCVRVMAGDENQSKGQNASISFVPALKDNHYLLTEQPLAIETLDKSYRNPQVVIDFAQIFLDLKLSIDHGRQSREQYTTYQANAENRPGQLTVTDTLAFENLPFDTAVIVHDQTTKDLLHKAHPTLFVLAANEAEGLEFEHVILYHLLEDPNLSATEQHLKSFYNNATKTVALSIDVHPLHQTKEKAAPIQNSLKTQGLKQLFLAATRSKDGVTLVLNPQPANPILNQWVKERVAAIISPDNAVATAHDNVDDKQNESSKEREESKENDRREEPSVKTKRVEPPVNSAERKALIEQKITTLIRQHQFTFAENYVLANRQWCEGFDMQVFVEALLKKTTDKELPLIWALRGLLRHLQGDHNDQQALLKMSEESQYEALFIRIVKLAQNNETALPTLLYLIQQANPCRLTLDTIQIAVGKKKKSALEYIVNLIKNYANKQNEHIQQLAIEMDAWQKKKKTLTSKNPKETALKETAVKTSHQPQYLPASEIQSEKGKKRQQFIEAFLKLSDAVLIKANLDNLYVNKHFTHIMFETPLQGKMLIEHLLINAQLREIFINWACERDKQGLDLTAFYVGMQERPLLFKTYFKDDTLQQDIGLLFLLGLRHLEDTSLLIELEHPRELMAFFIAQLGSQVFSKTNDSLLLRLVDKPLFLALIEKMRNQLISPESLMAVRPRDNMSALYFLSVFKQRQALFLKIVNADEKLLASIPLEVWCAPNKDNTSALYGLAGQPDGRVILEKLLTSQEGLQWLHSPLFIEALCKLQPDGSSALYWIAANSDGRRWLYQLLTESKPLCALIPLKTLGAVSKLHGLSIVYFLSGSLDGQLSLCEISKANDKLTSIPLETWCLPYKKNNMSAIHCLAIGSDEGRDLLRDLLAANKASFTSLIIETLYAPSQPRNISALNGLACSNNGQSLLLELLTTHEPLYSPLFIQALCRLSSDANQSPLYWLAREPNGVKVLEMLLNMNETLFFSIPIEAWCQRAKDDNGSAFHYLVSLTKGEELLRKIITVNEAFFLSIPNEAWFATCTNDDVPAIYYLPGNRSDGQVMFEKLLTKNQEIASLITIETLRATTKSRGLSMFYWLSDNESSQKLLHLLVESNPALLSSIDVSLLCTRAKDDQTSPLYNLASTASGRQFLDKLFTVNEKLLSLIPHEELWALYDKNNDSVLSWVLSHPDDRELLAKFLAVKKDLFSRIPQGIWFAPSKDDKTTLFYWLARNKSSRDLLNQFVLEKRQFLSWVPTEALCDINETYNICILYVLASSINGRQFLQELFTANEELLSTIPEKSLYRSFGTDNVSTFYWLLKSDSGIQLLQRILNANKALLSLIPAETLYARHSSDNTCAFYWLLSSDLRHQWLVEILTANEELLSLIPAETLYALNTEDNSSILFKLSAKQPQIGWLQKIFNANKKLYALMPEESLCGLTPYNQSSAIYWLAGNDGGRETLNALAMENETILSSIPIKTLCSPQKMSTLYYLAGNVQQNYFFLEKLLDKNPALVSSDFIEALSVRHPPTNQSGLYWLSKLKKGVEFLEKLFNKNPKLFSFVPEDTWNAVEANDNGSIWYWLAATSYGQTFLPKLIFENPQLIFLISLDVLCARVCPNNYSLFFWLASTKYGLELLEKILSNTGQLLSPAHIETLCTVNKKDNTSVFSALASSQKGRILLEKIMAENKDLLFSIPIETWCSVNKNQGNPAIYELASTDGRVFLEKLMPSNIALSVSLKQQITTLMEEAEDQLLKAKYRALLWVLKEINNELTIDEIPLEENENSIKNTLDHCARIGFKNTLQLLLQSSDKAQPITDNCKSSLLCTAVANNQRTIVDFFLEQKVDVNCLEKDGATPLLIALQNGHEKLVELLLNHGADPTIPIELTESAFLDFGRDKTEFIHKNIAEYISEHKNSNSQSEGKIRLLPYHLALIMGNQQIAHRLNSFKQNNSSVNQSYSSIFSLRNVANKEVDEPHIHNNASATSSRLNPG